MNDESKKLYNTGLGAGLGVVDQTRTLLKLWQPGISPKQLFQYALNSGSFPGMSARRLRNLVCECFASRYLTRDDYPAAVLKKMAPFLTLNEFIQILLLYTCRVNLILADFIHEVYWDRYSSGHGAISNLDAREFVVKAVRQGKTVKPWTDNMIERVAGYLTRCCADFGMLEPGIKKSRRIIPFRMESRVAAFLAYDLHFSGEGDNTIVASVDWERFGMDREDVLDELKRLSLQGLLIVQAAGDVIWIGWNHKSWEELIDVLAQR